MPSFGPLRLKLAPSDPPRQPERREARPVPVRCPTVSNKHSPLALPLRKAFIVRAAPVLTKSTASFLTPFPLAEDDDKQIAFYYGTLMTERTFWMGEQSLKATFLAPPPMCRQDHHEETHTHKHTQIHTRIHIHTQTRTQTDRSQRETTHNKHTNLTRSVRANTGRHARGVRIVCLLRFSLCSLFCVPLRRPSHPAGAPSDERTAAGPGRHSWRSWVVEQGRAGGVMPAPLVGDVAPPPATVPLRISCVHSSPVGAMTRTHPTMRHTSIHFFCPI